MSDLSTKIKQRKQKASQRPAFGFDIARRYAEHIMGNGGCYTERKDMQSMLRAFSYEPCLVNAGSHARRSIYRAIFGLYTEALWVYRPSDSGSIDRLALGL